MSNIHIVHALDGTTEFLSVFREHFPENFFVLEPKVESVEKSISYMKNISEESLIIFLGHGHSTGLYTPEKESFQKEIFVNIDLANKIFEKKIIILLTCNSNQFIKKIKNYRYIIGFGNILSSMQEVSAEAEITTGVFRNLSEGDIEYFNTSYCNAVVSALKKFQSNALKHSDLPKLIEYFINQRINETLLKKQIPNRVEIAKLLFEFRNEMKFFQN